MPPIHPALVHFPIALITLSFVAELLGYLRESARLRAAAFVSLVFATLSLVLTAAAGYYDMNRAALGETHEYVAFHTTVGLCLFVLAAGLTLWRWRIERVGRGIAGPAYIGAAFLVLAVTVFQGWYGGEMVFSQGAGVAAAGKGTESPEAGKSRLEAVTIEGLGHEDEHEHPSQSTDAHR